MSFRTGKFLTGSSPPSKFPTIGFAWPAADLSRGARIVHARKGHISTVATAESITRQMTTFIQMDLSTLRHDSQAQNPTCRGHSRSRRRHPLQYRRKVNVSRGDVSFTNANTCRPKRRTPDTSSRGTLGIVPPGKPLHRVDSWNCIQNGVNGPSAAPHTYQSSHLIDIDCFGENGTFFPVVVPIASAIIKDFVHEADRGGFSKCISA